MGPVWIDMQLPPGLAQWLVDRMGVTAEHFQALGHDRTPDEAAFAAARAADAVILTKDSDFARLVQRYGAPPRILWLRCGNTSTRALCDLLERVAPQAFALLEAGEPLVEIAESPST
ncbi:MAG: DUF5615 family PIN-like protein [Phycisphaerales bacterium JB039]